MNNLTTRKKPMSRWMKVVVVGFAVLMFAFLYIGDKVHQISVYPIEVPPVDEVQTSILLDKFHRHGWRSLTLREQKKMRTILERQVIDSPILPNTATPLKQSNGE